MTETKTPSPLRLIPSVDAVLRDHRVTRLRETLGTRRTTGIVRHVVSELRERVMGISAVPSVTGTTSEELLDLAVARIHELCQLDQASGLQKVINATGVVLHTNLGRAPLSDAAREALVNAASRYCTLEYDTRFGTRGARGGRVEFLLQQLTGAEDALVVNNCAAAALFVLSILARNGETIVSRGELVEIGGDFRVPDVMSTSGTRMIEVGTTNRTTVEDYAKAVTADTKLIMRVHPSNYRIIGFTSAPSLVELANVAHAAGVPLYEDAGSGLLQDLSMFGIADESTVSDHLRAGVDVITFSGDKLLGAAQSGLIVGRKLIIDRLRKHPLYRALRCDKLRLAVLEATLESHQRDQAIAEIPTLKMLALTATEIRTRSEDLIAAAKANVNLFLTVCEGESAVGGGAAPTSKLPTTLVSLKHKSLSAQELEERLRGSSPPVISRIADDQVLLDLRTVFPDEQLALIEVLKKI